MYTRRRTATLKAATCAAVSLCSGAACADAEVGLPAATPLPTQGIRLGMTPRDLRVARPRVELGVDGVHREAYLGDWVVYGFWPRTEGAPPPPTAGLRYVERTEEVADSLRLLRRWTEVLGALEAELGAAAECISFERGLSSLRRARFEAEATVLVSWLVTRAPDGRRHDAFLTTTVVVADPDGSSPGPAGGGMSVPHDVDRSARPCEAM